MAAECGGSGLAPAGHHRLASAARHRPHSAPHPRLGAARLHARGHPGDLL